MEGMPLPSSVAFFTVEASKSSLQVQANFGLVKGVYNTMSPIDGFLSSQLVPFFAGLVGQPEFVSPASCIDISECQSLLFPLPQGYETTKIARSSHPTMGHVYIGQTLKPDEGGRRVDHIWWTGSSSAPYGTAIKVP